MRDIIVLMVSSSPDFQHYSQRILLALCIGGFNSNDWIESFFPRLRRSSRSLFCPCEMCSPLFFCSIVIASPRFWRRYVLRRMWDMLISRHNNIVDVAQTLMSLLLYVSSVTEVRRRDVSDNFPSFSPPKLI